MPLLACWISVLLVLSASMRAASLQIASGPYSSGKTYLTCLVDGQKERCFLDTGSAMTLVANSRRFGAYTNLGIFRFESASGIPQETETIQINSIQIDEFQFSNVKVGRVNFRGAENTLGIDIIGRQPFAINFHPQATLRLNANRPASPLTTLQVSQYGVISIPIALDAFDVHALWDTGGSLTSVEQNFIEAHPENFKPTKNYVNGVDGAGKSMLAQIFRAKKITIADHVFKDVRVVAVDLTTLRSGVHRDIQAVVGFDLIRKANWFFDPKNRLWNCDTKP